ncbi:hypothetical protein SAMN05216388_1010136 [Halorientalis persicus]|uniref:Uncharacterized protein n=1 Tax=Halorientalis persicus TaxID=1367881 RepID=A0A1H8NFL5_9EURY|nr:hypothetical protein [Halorientalis persicus]SEO28357.1 hypothetical protein SAMN05216388_1010136 [Halorientalis persicus]
MPPLALASPSGNPDPRLAGLLVVVLALAHALGGRVEVAAAARVRHWLSAGGGFDAATGVGPRSVLLGGAATCLVGTVLIEATLGVLTRGSTRPTASPPH